VKAQQFAGHAQISSVRSAPQPRSRSCQTALFFFSFLRRQRSIGIIQSVPQHMYITIIMDPTLHKQLIIYIITSYFYHILPLDCITIHIIHATFPRLTVSKTPLSARPPKGLGSNQPRIQVSFGRQRPKSWSRSFGWSRSSKEKWPSKRLKIGKCSSLWQYNCHAYDLGEIHRIVYQYPINIHYYDIVRNQHQSSW